VRAAFPDAPVEDLGPVTLLPGLVNAHTHLELSLCEAGDPPASFADWIVSLPARLQATGREDPHAAGVEHGIRQCLKFGVTCIGDISQHMRTSRSILRRSALRCVSFGEVIGLSGRQWRFEELLPHAIDTSLQTDRLTIGLSPHAPYTADEPGYRRCLAIARERQLPLATHLAETRDEQTFLEHHQGPFRKVWETLGSWTQPVQTYRGSPIAFARAVGLLDYPTLLAHVNYCSDYELDLLATGQASVVYCPRTHRYFGHPPHRWREMLERGINVAIGTDSCASSPDLNLLEDLRHVSRLAPDLAVEELWAMVTTRAARALGMGGEVGELSPGAWADLVAFEAQADPLKEVLAEARPPAGVWIAGQRI
jgi:cytosine/adenosine deaminase-related metal-dependent hydrolase